MPSHTIDAVHVLEPPTKLTELLSFFGLCNVIRRFVPNFAGVATLLNKKLRKDHLQTFDGLSYKEITALETLKAKLIELTVLVLPRLQDDYKIDTDAFDKRIDCVLLQNQQDGTNSQSDTVPIL